MRKILSFALALCLLVSICVPASAAKVDSMTDVPSGQWFYEAVSYCLEHGYMDGVGGGKFDPKGSVTRAQIAQVLYNKAGKPSTEGLANPFTDVTNGKWYKDAIVWCKANDVVSGTSTTTFAPTKPVSREQVCTMFFNYYKDYLAKAPELAEVSDMGKYTDWGKVSTWAQDAVRWAVKSGFMKGKSSTTLDPKGQATRAELAQFLVNFDNVLGTEKPVEPEKCEHGNDPATCPICNPEKPQGLYNPYPSDEEIDKVGFNPENNTADFEESEQLFFDNYDKAIHDSITNNMITCYGYEDYTPDQWITDTIKGGSYDIASHSYTPWGSKYENGTLYNRYGNDISNVDGAMTDFEFDIYRSFNVVLHYNNLYKGGSDKLLHELKFNSKLQAVAEDRLEQVKENLNNMAKVDLGTDWSEFKYADSSSPATVEAKLLGQSPLVTRKLVDYAKQFSNSSSVIENTNSWFHNNAASYWNQNDNSNKGEATDMIDIMHDFSGSAWYMHPDNGVNKTSQDWNYELKTRVLRETIVHFDQSVRDSARGISPADIVSAYFRLTNSNTLVTSIYGDFNVAVAYDPETSTAVFVTCDNVM